MESTVLGLVLDASVLIAAERRKLRADQAIESVQNSDTGFIAPTLSKLTAEIIARIGGEQAGRGVNIPLGDLVIGASAVELGFAVGTGNLRHFGLIPGLTVVPL
jgi:predicted nucleic acid-binding protein